MPHIQPLSLQPAALPHRRKSSQRGARVLRQQIAAGIQQHLRLGGCRKNGAANHLAGNARENIAQRTGVLRANNIISMLTVIDGRFVQISCLTSGSRQQRNIPVVHLDAACRRPGNGQLRQRAVEHHRAAGDHILHEKAVQTQPVSVQL